MKRAHFILYVADQDRSAEFYARVLDRKPRLHVPGMTEFNLPGGAVLGLMPEQGISRLLGDSMLDPGSAAGIPLAELYLVLDDPEACHQRAVDAGARELSPLQPRDWGHHAAYAIDSDGHVIARARETSEEADGLDQGSQTGV